MMRGQPSMSADLLKHLQEAGIRPDHPIVSYLTHIGLISDIAFVEFKPDTVELAGWCDKFKSEVTFGDNKIGPIDGDQLDVMKASLIATHKSITKKLGSSMPAAPPPTGPTVPSVITTRDLRRPSRSIQQSHYQWTAKNIPRETPPRSWEDHCEDVARTR